MTSLNAEQDDKRVILTIGIERRGRKVHFYKPLRAAFSDRYRIRQGKEAKEPSICIQGPFPVYLRIKTKIQIVGVGFAEAGKDPVQYTQKGHCGGCFTLHIDDADPRSWADCILLIQNDGESYQEGYVWWLWAKKGRFGENKKIQIEKLPIDPRIYNQGEIPMDPGKEC
ncbi:MAG TPA: hypothetical protein VF173_06290 [Thermoanaerobaculia bacterium]|nr:hypothetical protein [Thermoanaerobaculia bacterium]